jgi:hypothetical protein
VGSDRIGRAVLELSTGGGLLREFDQIKAGSRGVDSEFERLRRRAQDLGGELKRTVEKFQGRALIEEAQRVAQAVQQIGGASKLTQTELKSVAATVQEATAKLHRMGEDVPPSIRKLSAEIKTLDDASGKAKSGGLSSLMGGLGSLRTLLPALSLTAVVGGLGMMASQAFDTAGELIDLSNKTGLSTDALQEMRQVANQTGSSLDTFTNATYKLGINVAEGSNKARDAVKDLRLSYDELKAAKPEEQFRTVVAALEQVDNQQERNRLGTALFGKQFAEIAASIEEGYTKIASGARKSSREQLEALDEAGDAWQQFKDDVASGTVSILGNMAKGLQDIERAADSLTNGQKLALFAKGGGNPAAYLASLKEMGAELARLGNARKEDINLGAAAAVAQRNYVTELAALKAKLAELNPEQRRNLDAALELEGASEELAAAFGLTEQALRLYTSSQKTATKATSDHAKEIERLQKLAAGARLGDYFKQLSGEGIRASITATNKELHDHVDNLDRMTTSYFGVVPATVSWQAALVPLKGAVTEVNGAIVQQTHDVTALALRMRDVGRTISGVLVQAFTGGGGLDGALKALGTMGGQKLGERLGESLAAALPGKLGAVLGGAAGPIGAALGGLAGSLVGKLFGGGEGKKVNDLRDKFTDAAGGIHALNVKAQAAGLTLDRFLRAKTVQEYEAAVKELEQAFADLEEQTRQNQEAANTLFDDIMAAGAEGVPAAMRETIERFIELGLLTDDQIAKLRGLGDSGAVNIKKMDDALALFNGRVEALGPAYAQAKIDETSAKYINAIDYATKHGASLDQMLHDAKEELSSLVVESLKSGTSLPANMKPWIESLAAQGKLIDENGQKITDLSGINWGPEMKTEAQIAREGWDRILLAIEALIDKITGPLETALDDVTRDRTINIRPKVGTVVIPDYDQEYGRGERGFATGIFRGRFPSTGERVRLHNIESVVPERDELSFAQRVLAEKGASITTNNTSQAAILGVIMGDGRSTEEIGRSAARFLVDKGLAYNVADVAAAFSQFVDVHLMNRGLLRGAR